VVVILEKMRENNNDKGFLMKIRFSDFQTFGRFLNEFIFMRKPYNNELMIIHFEKNTTRKLLK